MSRSGGYKCYNMSCRSCVARTLCGEPGDTALNCVDRIVSSKTNADLIRAMSDEELARVIGHLYDGEAGILFCRNLAECDDDIERNLLIPLERCEACVLHWLRQPAEGGLP